MRGLRFNTEAQWIFRIIAFLLLFMLAILLSSLDMFALVYFPELLQEELFFEKVFRLPVLIASFVVALGIDHFIGRIADEPVREF